MRTTSTTIDDPLFFDDNNNGAVVLEGTDKGNDEEGVVGSAGANSDPEAEDDADNNDDADVVEVIVFIEVAPVLFDFSTDAGNDAIPGAGRWDFAFDFDFNAAAAIVVSLFLL